MEKTEDNKIADKKSPVVETLDKDILEMVEKHEAGVVHAIIQGEEEKEKIEINYSPTSNKNKMLIGFSILFIILAILSLYIFFYLENKKQSVFVATQYKPLIYTDGYKLLSIQNLSKEKIIDSLYQEIQNTETKTGEIEVYYLTENNTPISFEKFIKIFEMNIGLETISEFNSSFLLGVFSNEEKNFFILLKPNTVNSVFNGMKIWENKMLFDLGSLFKLEINKDTNYLLTKNFVDGIIQNKNARILYDNDGQIILAYIYLDDNTILITKDEFTAREILVRLHGSNLKK